MTKKEVLDWLYRIKSKLTMYFPLKWVSECEQAIDYAIKALENQKTGHWVFQRREGAECVYKCSNCGREITRFDELCDFERLFAYCPECGAKMEGE